MAFSTTKIGQWLSAMLAHRFDNLSVRGTSGKHSLSGWLSGQTIAILTTRGAKSGLPRSIPVMVTWDGDLVVLISSNWGQNRHPGWYYNLRADPHAELELNGETRSYLAREAKGEERERYWSLAVKNYPGYDIYRERASQRQIAVWVLEPVRE
jgi:deazaflavin-dependent oxidoreductase (nitroreductase family)